MPLVDFNNPSVWDELYAASEGGMVLHFERRAKSLILGEDHQTLRTALGLRGGEAVALIGAGFGWVAEDWKAAGLGPVLAVDTSKYLHSNLPGNAIVPILDADVSTPIGRQDIRYALGGVVDWVISEDVMPCFTDEEAVALAEGMRKLAPNVVHWVSIKGGSRSALNWKTAIEWKQLLTPDKVVARGYSTVL